MSIFVIEESLSFDFVVPALSSQLFPSAPRPTLNSPSATAVPLLVASSLIYLTGHLARSAQPLTSLIALWPIRDPDWPGVLHYPDCHRHPPVLINSDSIVFPSKQPQTVASNNGGA
jgi:hypothetical protein